MSGYVDVLNEAAKPVLAPGERFAGGTKCHPHRGAAWPTAVPTPGSAAVGLTPTASSRHGFGNGLAASIPLTGQMAIGVTEHRLVLLAVSAGTGRPSRSVASIPVIKIQSVIWQAGPSMAIIRRGTLSITFRDGSVLALEVERLSRRSAEHFVEELARRAGTTATG